VRVGHERVATTRQAGLAVRGRGGSPSGRL